MTSKGEKDRAKQIQDRCQNILIQMLKDEDNKYCVDCDAKGMLKFYFSFFDHYIGFEGFSSNWMIFLSVPNKSGLSELGVGVC